MAVLYVYLTMGSWCPRCREWMGWRGDRPFEDYDAPNGMHANCSPFLRGVMPPTMEPQEKRPRTRIRTTPLPELEDYW